MRAFSTSTSETYVSYMYDISIHQLWFYNQHQQGEVIFGDIIGPFD